MCWSVPDHPPGESQHLGTYTATGRVDSFLLTTPRLVPFHMAPQGVSDVIVPLEALSEEVLDGFNRLFLDVGQPPMHLTITRVPPPCDVSI